MTTQQTPAQWLENLYDQLANITPAKGSIHDPRDWLLAEALAKAANATTQEEDT